MIRIIIDDTDYIQNMNQNAKLLKLNLIINIGYIFES